MKSWLKVFMIISLVSIVLSKKPPSLDLIVEENGICLEEIKTLELCLSEAGQGKGWCEIGATVIEPSTHSPSTDEIIFQIQQKQFLFA